MDEQRVREIANEVAEQRMYGCAKQAAHEAIAEAFDKLGIDYSDPLTAQKRAQTLATVTKWMDRGGITAVTTIVTLLVTGAAMMIWRLMTGDGWGL